VAQMRSALSPAEHSLTIQGNRPDDGGSKHLWNVGKFLPATSQRRSSQMNSIHILQLYFPEIHFTIILAFICPPRSPSGFTIRSISHLIHATYMAHHMFTLCLEKNLTLFLWNSNWPQKPTTGPNNRKLNLVPMFSNLRLKDLFKHFRSMVSAPASYSGGSRIKSRSGTEYRDYCLWFSSVLLIFTVLL
jgi:hypothetical protein